MSIKMTLAPKGEIGGYEMTEPGRFFWRVYKGQRWLKVMVPTDKVEAGCIYISLPVSPTEAAGSWSWNGDEDRPTLTPSVDAVGYWHGLITDGHMVGK